jgi:AcrR family transcriptional regulator
VEIAQTVVLEQIKLDSERLDGNSIVVGPFARLDANKVAALDGKTRGAITNVFGSQAAFQADTMARALDAGDLIEQIEYPAPGDFPDADAWVDAFFAAESARGPMHGSEPTVSYAYLWALWLSVVPYGLWSEQIARPSMEEYARWLERLEQVLEQALDHFALTLQEGTTVGDLANAVGSMIEGVWLNQCLSTCHPTDPSEPVATAMRRSGRLLWRGATRPRAAGSSRAADAPQ